MRVLIIEGGADDAERIISALKTARLNVVWERAETETEYLAALERRPDIVLATHGSARLDVARAVGLLQARGVEIPLIVVGGATDAEQAAPVAERTGEERYRRIADELQTRLLELVVDFARRETSWWDTLSEKEAALSETATRLQAATAALEEAAARLTQIPHLTGEIISTVSHELRAPLNNIQLYLDLLESGKPERRPQYLATLRHEALLMQGLVEDVLQLVRLDFGNVSPVLEPVEASQILLRLAEDRRELARQKGLNLEACLMLNLPPVMADARMLAEVLSNLLSNAINYTPEGGTISMLGEVSEQEGRPGVALAVSDTGPGIAPEELPRVFERYYRGEAARRSKAPGTGLGLAIADEIVRRHGGQIDVQSTPGQGSTFTVWLPALTPEGVDPGDQHNSGGAI
jgi:signal transduction histidine kinase